MSSKNRVMIAVITAFIFYCYGQCSAFPAHSGRTVGGVEATPHEFPWQVSLQWSGGHLCGGVLIGEKTILTTTNCMQYVNLPAYLYIVAGRHQLNNTLEDETQQRKTALRISRHPDYPGGPTGRANDIAVINVGTPFEFNDIVKPIPIAEVGQAISGTGIISGWGSAREEEISNQNALIKSNVPIIPDSDCKAVYGDDFDAASMICAGNLVAGGIDFCTGDAGGPLVVQNEDGSYFLAGLSSWGYGCGQPGFPGVYTEVSYFTEFIKQFTQT